MKKSQLRNIIRESIKGLMTEQLTQSRHIVITKCVGAPTNENYFVSLSEFPSLNVGDMLNVSSVPNTQTTNQPWPGSPGIYFISRLYYNDPNNLSTGPIGNHSIVSPNDFGVCGNCCEESVNWTGMEPGPQHACYQNCPQPNPDVSWKFDKPTLTTKGPGDQGGIFANPQKADPTRDRMNTLAFRGKNISKK